MVRNSEKTAGGWLFFVSPTRRRPRISAENERPLADNSWRKQQEQRETRLKTSARYLSATQATAAHARGGPT